MKKRRDCEERFRERYSTRVTEAALVVEREVIGANVGANGYTTVEQTDMLAKRLELKASATLLDIGSGRGWPGSGRSISTARHPVFAARYNAGPGGGDSEG